MQSKKQANKQLKQQNSQQYWSSFELTKLRTGDYNFADYFRRIHIFSAKPLGDSSEIKLQMNFFREDTCQGESLKHISYKICGISRTIETRWT